MIRILACAIFAIFPLAAQTTETPGFEKASIERSASTAGDNALSTDPAHIRYTGVTLNSVLALAYGVRPDQIVAPKWMNTERFDISATPPAGTTERQVPAMLRRLLTDRFHMTVHEETKNRTFYALVPAPGGVKMKPTEKPEISATLDLSSDSIQLKDYSMVSFANFLTNAMHEPVVDETGFTGTFDIRLYVSMADIRSAKAMGAIHQLGLNFEKRSGATKLVVVDKVDKAPVSD